jgi:hypothetical protein
VDQGLRDALEEYRQKYDLDDLSAATRHILRRALRTEGFLKAL